MTIYEIVFEIDLGRFDKHRKTIQVSMLDYEVPSTEEELIQLIFSTYHKEIRHLIKVISITKRNGEDNSL